MDNTVVVEFLCLDVWKDQEYIVINPCLCDLLFLHLCLSAVVPEFFVHRLRGHFHNLLFRLMLGGECHFAVGNFNLKTTSAFKAGASSRNFLSLDVALTEIE